MKKKLVFASVILMLSMLIGFASQVHAASIESDFGNPFTPNDYGFVTSTYHLPDGFYGGVQPLEARLLRSVSCRWYDYGGTQYGTYVTDQWIKTCTFGSPYYGGSDYTTMDWSQFYDCLNVYDLSLDLGGSSGSFEHTEWSVTYTVQWNLGHWEFPWGWPTLVYEVVDTSAPFSTEHNKADEPCCMNDIVATSTFLGAYIGNEYNEIGYEDDSNLAMQWAYGGEGSVATVVGFCGYNCHGDIYIDGYRFTDAPLLVYVSEDGVNYQFIDYCWLEWGSQVSRTYVGNYFNNFHYIALAAYFGASGQCGVMVDSVYINYSP